MSKHTPGPWGQLGRKRNEHKTIPLRSIYCEALGYHVAFVSDDHDGEARANARLIAAAPKLLEALKYCAERLQIHIKHTEDLIAHMQAIKAITEAEGPADE
jgi:outer membrane translocation and assembly module TamA